MDDITKLLNAVHLAEIRQLTMRVAPQPLPSAPVMPASNLAEIVGQIADTMEREQYDEAVFAIKEALTKHPSANAQRLLSQMLPDAEAALKQQMYTREAERDYAPIRELVRRAKTRTVGCAELADFHKRFPDYDPDNLADLCQSSQPSPPPTPVRTKPRVTDLLPAPFAWIPILAGKVTLKTEKGWAKNYIPEGQSQTFDVSAFQIAKYPLTNAQYKLFVDAGGYKG